VIPLTFVKVIKSPATRVIPVTKSGELSATVSLPRVPLVCPASHRSPVANALTLTVAAKAVVIVKAVTAMKLRNIVDAMMAPSRV
jgi:hypothetical protein